MTINVGSTVLIERNETLHPPKGTWPQFRGKTGTVIEINNAGLGAAEYAVGFGKARRASAWFKSHELTVMTEEAADV